MHYQLYDDEEEFEPRVTPKPITKHDCVLPTVPEVSLIFEKSTVKNSIDESTDLFKPSLLRPLQNTDGVTEIIDPTLPVSHDPNSYAAWKEQNYSKEINPTTCLLRLCKNTRNCNHTLNLQKSSVQKQQEQSDNNEKQKLQNANKNDRIYEKSVKFQCSNIENSCDPKSKTHLSSDKKHSSDFLQRATLNIPHNGCQQFPLNVSSQCSYSNCNTDNNETVKTLLQLVNSQNEQIKSLQLQINRLVRMQEENFKNKSTCSCLQPLANQVFKYPINCYDTGLASSLAQSQNQDLKKSTVSQSASVVEKQNVENFGENKLETALLEQPSKKAFMEQKVSIGVMTSFEFTVQNSPFLIDSELSEKRDAHREGNNISRTNTVNICDATEPINKYKNTYMRKSGVAQLENIIEDSESYLSSSQQQSSNFNANSSMKGTSKMYQHLSTDIRQEKAHKEVFNIGKDNVNKQVQNARNMSNISMNVDYSPIGSTNCSKAFIEQTNDYIVEGKKNVYKTNVSEYSSHNIHLPVTDYYCNYRNKEYGANGRQIKDISDSMVLSGGDLKILERPPTPEPSIHVEMQEYTSDDESDKLRHTSKIGWTFYNNVLGQVNEILQNSAIISNKELNHAKVAPNNEQENDMKTRTALNTVKTATLEQLRKLGISLIETNEYKESNNNNTLDFDSSFYPRLDHHANITHATSIANETNTSMHMKALATKYLSDEQLADVEWQKQESSSLKHLMLSNMQGTNMSLATMHYLERYQLLPGRNNVQPEDTNQIYDKISSKHDFKPMTTNKNPALRRFPFVQTSGTCPSKILDLSTLKRQPKLL
ncbi:uncharacterized protein PF11_0213 isoform X2 [Monomorium pharaonis]|uniref:uncharacterized protein PF11_0213 isoform X2 n=1 Tax=Monomorium pharaonis TaxID=307658 RepID=UPI00063FB519|nr:uncharacterized protein PF11_0213 isoform X2 [Monomorium pharaonis]